MITNNMDDAAPRRPRRLPAPVAATISSLARGILLAAASMLLWAAIPATWGWAPTTVMSDSMAPNVRTGDVIVSMPLAGTDLKVGQILLVKDPDHEGRLRLHRFASTDDKGMLVLKGDANPEPDSSHVDPADVVGAGVLRIPYVGLPVVWLRDAQPLPLVAAAAVGALLFLMVKMDPTTPALFRLRSRAAVASRRPRTAPNRRPFVLVGTVGAVVGVILAGIGLTTLTSAPASAAFSAASPNPSSALSAAAAYDCLTPAAPDSPYFYYRYAETTGTSVTDTSGNARTGTLRGTTTRVAGSCVAGATPALTLDGSTGYVSTPNSVAGTNTFTIEAWFKTTTASGGRIIGFGNAQTGTSSNADRHLYMTNAGKISFGVQPTGTRTAITSPISYNDGAWHLATATLSSAGMILYIDGTQVATNSSVTAARSLTGYWRVGGDTLSGWPSAPTSNFFAGTVDGTAAYTTALTAAKVAAHYAAGR
ncbi:signal peptidase I [Amnibacterium flavum]|uniref:Signal peptidase I n=1 Tax=Amnibacterium flavum TaxID=2173173 RepID=A0A2V1HTA9_9MICO|nr:signal peptidase I [Amnibacterium flavum]PVZ94289.1 signal peptidase I [Amnibacterium flavum]